MHNKNKIQMLYKKKFKNECLSRKINSKTEQRMYGKTSKQ